MEIDISLAEFGDFLIKFIIGSVGVLVLLYLLSLIKKRRYRRFNKRKKNPYHY